MVRSRAEQLKNKNIVIVRLSLQAEIETAFKNTEVAKFDNTVERILIRRKRVIPN